MGLKEYKFVWRLARRDLVEDKKITVIVVAMLAFSFLNLAFFPAFIEGLTVTFNSALIETQTGDVAVHPEEGYIENADNLVEKISRLEDVKEVEKRIEGSIRVSYKGEHVETRFIATSTLGSKVYQSRVQDGRFISSEDARHISLGGAVAEEEDGVGIEPGRIVTLTSERWNYTAEYKVVGTIGRPGPGSLTGKVVIPYGQGEEIIGRKDVATSVKILLEGKKPSEFKARLQRLNVRGEIETWSEQSEVAGSIARTFGIVTFIVSVVGVVIALTSVGVVIFINTSKRSREMGIIRAIGTESRRVIQVFVLEAFVLGVVGVLFGNAILLGIDSFLQSNPVASPMGPLSTVVTFRLLWTRSAVMLGSSLVAGFIPAYLVSKHNIVETIESR